MEGDTLTYSVVTPPAHGTVSISGSTATYTPSANYNGPDSFTFKANDGRADSNVATVSVTVTPVNDAPAAQNGSATTTENTPVSVALHATDVDGDALICSVVAAPAHGTITISGFTATYAPASNFSGSDSFTFKANDGHLDSNVATVSLSVSCTQESNSQFCAQHSAVCGSVTANDNCGVSRTVACGTCSGDKGCDANHQCRATCDAYTSCGTYTLICESGFCEPR